MAYVPGVALLAALAVGCSAGADSDANGTDSKAGTPTVTPAPPASTSPCRPAGRACQRSTLKDLLPGAAGTARGPAGQGVPGLGVPSRTTRTARSGAAGRPTGRTPRGACPSTSNACVSYDPPSATTTAPTPCTRRGEGRRPVRLGAPGPPDEKDKKDKKDEGSEGAGKAKDPAGGDADATDSADPSPSGSDNASSGGSTGGIPGGLPAAAGGGPPSRILDDLGDAAFLQDLPKRQVLPHSTTR